MTEVNLDYSCQLCGKPCGTQFPCNGCKALFFCRNKHRTQHRTIGHEGQECKRMRQQMQETGHLCTFPFTFWADAGIMGQESQTDRHLCSLLEHLHCHMHGLWCHVCACRLQEEPQSSGTLQLFQATISPPLSCNAPHIHRHLKPCTYSHVSCQVPPQMLNLPPPIIAVPFPAFPSPVHPTGVHIARNFWELTWALKPPVLPNFPGATFPPHVPLSSWEDYYQHRGLSLSSPAALALDHVLTLYLALQLVNELQGQQLLQPGHHVHVHYLGPQHEVHEVQLFLELAWLLPQVHLHIDFIGPDIPAELHGHSMVLHAEHERGAHVQGGQEESVHAGKTAGCEWASLVSQLWPYSPAPTPLKADLHCNVTQPSSVVRATPHVPQPHSTAPTPHKTDLHCNITQPSSVACDTPLVPQPHSTASAPYREERGSSTIHPPSVFPVTPFMPKPHSPVPKPHREESGSSTIQPPLRPHSASLTPPTAGLESSTFHPPSVFSATSLMPKPHSPAPATPRAELQSSTIHLLPVFPATSLTSKPHSTAPTTHRTGSESSAIQPPLMPHSPAPTPPTAELESSTIQPPPVFSAAPLTSNPHSTTPASHRTGRECRTAQPPLTPHSPASTPPTAELESSAVHPSSVFSAVPLTSNPHSTAPALHRTGRECSAIQPPLTPHSPAPTPPTAEPKHITIQATPVFSATTLSPSTNLNSILKRARHDLSQTGTHAGLQPLQLQQTSQQHLHHSHNPPQQVSNPACTHAASLHSTATENAGMQHRQDTTPIHMSFHQCLYHELDRTSHPAPNLVFAPNAGLPAYMTWLPTLQLLCCADSRPPMFITDYCEEALVKSKEMLGHILGAEERVPTSCSIHGSSFLAANESDGRAERAAGQVSDNGTRTLQLPAFHGPSQRCLADGLEGSMCCQQGVENFQEQVLESAKISPVLVNPFRQPSMQTTHGNKLPAFKNGFFMIVNM